MDYEFRNYEAQIPMYRQSSSSSSQSSHPMYAPPPPPSSALYPKIGQSPAHTVHPPAGRPYPHHQNPNPNPPPSSSGLGIRVTIKPEYRITPPPQLSPQLGDIPRCNFQFDFELERKILAEAEKESPNWVKLGLENLPARTPAPTSSVGSVTDPIVGKYIASGLNREAVTLAVGHYGDNPTKVRDFVNGYNLLREMGFPSKSVFEALITNDNDTDKALTHFIPSSS